MQRLNYVVSMSLSHYHGKRPYQACLLVKARFHVRTNVVFGLGTRLRMHIRTRLENGILRNGQQPSSAVNIFTDQGKFEAMKTLSGRRAPCCGKHQFRAKITANKCLLEPSSSYHC